MFADQHVDDAGAAQQGAHDDPTGMGGDDLAEASGVPALGQGAHRGQDGVGDIGRDDGDETSFVGDMQRVQAEQVACGGDHGRDGYGVLRDLDSDPGRRGDLVQRRCHAAAGGVAHRVNPPTAAGHHRRDQAVQGTAVGGDVGLEAETFARTQDGAAVGADGTGQDDDVPGSREPG